MNVCMHVQYVCMYVEKVEIMIIYCMCVCVCVCV